MFKVGVWTICGLANLAWLWMNWDLIRTVGEALT